MKKLFKYNTKTASMFLPYPYDSWIPNTRATKSNKLNAYGKLALIGMNTQISEWDKRQHIKREWHWLRQLNKINKNKNNCYVKNRGVFIRERIQSHIHNSDTIANADISESGSSWISDESIGFVQSHRVRKRVYQIQLSSFCPIFS